MTGLQGANSVYLYQEQVGRPHSGQGMTVWPLNNAVVRKPAASATPIDRRQTVHLDCELDELRRGYVFSVESSIRPFLVKNRAIRATLRDALSQLQASFGHDRVFSLELSTEEEGSPTLYAVTIWPDSVQSAVRALRQFEESWWLDHMTQSTTNLAFVYEIA